MRPLLRSCATILLASGLGVACAGKSAQKGAAGPPAKLDQATTDDPEALSRQLDDYEAQLREHGVAPGGGDAQREIVDETTVEDRADATTATRAPDETDACSRICDLAEAICELEARICDLADRHADEPRYRDACRRAERDCEMATTACRECSGG